jgi:hypothetical protein
MDSVTPLFRVAPSAKKFAGQPGEALLSPG